MNIKRHQFKTHSLVPRISLENSSKHHGEKDGKKQNRNNRWKPPNPNSYKVNVDGGFDGEKAGVGIVTRDATGDVIAAMAARTHNAADMEHAEAVAMLRGIQIAHDLVLPTFYLESDYLSLIQKIQTAEEDWSHIGHVIQRLKSLISNPKCISISHVNRKANIPTHLLVKFGCNLDEYLVWMEEAADFVTSALMGFLCFKKKKKV